jgi:hypothetical protein
MYHKDVLQSKWSKWRKLKFCSCVLLQSEHGQQFMELELQFFLRPAVSWPVPSGYRASLWDPWPGFYLALLTSSDNYFFLLSKAPSLTRKRGCSLQCNHSLVRSLTPNNHTLLSHLRLCSLFVASYDDSQGLRWKYSNPPPHGVAIHVRVQIDFIPVHAKQRNRHSEIQAPSDTGSHIEMGRSSLSLYVAIV